MRINGVPFALSIVCLSIAAEGLAAPAWIDGKDPRYGRERYVAGVGHGPDRASADIAARAEVARVFESEIAAVMKDFQAAATTVNGSGKGVSVEVQSVASYQEVTTKKTLSSVELREHAQDGKVHYTLALLDRAQCVTALGEQIGAIDAKLRSLIQRAEAAEKLEAFKAYGAALNLMDEREGLNAMLRVCDLSGHGVPPPAGLANLTAKFEEASGSLRLGVDLSGSGAARVRDCLMEQLGEKGYQLVEIQVDDAESDEEETDEDGEPKGQFDAILRGRLKSEKAGEIAGSQMVRTDLVIKLINPRTKKTLKTVSASRKEGRPSIQAAASLSAYKLCQKEMPDLAKELDKAFKR